MGHMKKNSQYIGTFKYKRQGEVCVSKIAQTLRSFGINILLSKEVGIEKDRKKGNFKSLAEGEAYLIIDIRS